MTYFVDYLPVTAGNKPTLYIDGKDYCTDLFVALHAATKFVFLTGLHFMRDFELVRGKGVERGKSGLARTLALTSERGVEVFLLVNQFWADEREIWEHDVMDWGKQQIAKEGELWGYLPETYRLFMTLKPYKNIHCRTELHPNTHTFGTHHQKTVVIDDKVAFLGGIDLTSLDGDRWDTGTHKRDYRDASNRSHQYWHDIHMQVTGPAVQFVRDNFVQRWTNGALHTLRLDGTRIKADVDAKKPALPRFPKPRPYRYPTGDETPDEPLVQIVRSMPATLVSARTKPAWNKSSSNWERSCKDAYLLGIRAARRYIYLENQWVSDEDIWAELAAAAKRNRDNADFRIVLMIPHKPLFLAGLGSNQELWIGSEMEDVIDASRDEATFGVYSVLQHDVSPTNGQLGDEHEVYVHSKIMIVDDEWSLIGSANSGGISLEGVRSGRDRPDTELSAIVLDREFASSFRQKLWEEHLERSVDKTYASRDADHFRRIAAKRGDHGVHFAIGYDMVRYGYTTMRPARRGWIDRTSQVPVGLFKKFSRIMAAPGGAQGGLPGSVNVAYRASVFPAPPDGYRLWYRWKVMLNFDLVTGQRSPDSIDFKMRSLRYDRDEVYEYSDQEVVYIGAETARAIDREIVVDIAHALIVCRVQVVPMHEGPDPDNGRHDSFVLELPVTFVREALLRSNYDAHHGAFGPPGGG